MIRTLLAAILFSCAFCLAQERPDLLIADFEGADYGKWAASGDAFGSGPAHGTLPNQQAVSGFLGKGLVNSYLGGDKSTGTLTSPAFTIERKYINFLVGGGAHAGETCINLLIDGKSVRTATGAEDEHLDWSTWDVAEFSGKGGVIQIVDKATGGWGHINLDQIIQSDTRKQADLINTTELYNETYRPQFHFTAKKNWINDPNGLVYFAGEYHLFFQHNPAGINWGNMTWGHAVSPDLVHWEQIQNALEPDEMGTMFSGSAVIDANNSAGFGKDALVVIYTAAGGTSEASKGKPFTQCLAWSTDRGRTFTKYAQNPVLKHIVGGNRDPKIVWHESSHAWIMALYLDKSDFGLFTSPNLKDWKQIQTITLKGCSECPDFFPLAIEGEKEGQKWVLTAANGHYLLGDFDGQKFTPDDPTPRIADYGKNYYAVQTYSNTPDGRRIQIAWMNGGRFPKMPFNHQMSFPCELRLRRLDDGLRLCRTPVREIEKLHGPEHDGSHGSVADLQNLLAGITGELFDIRLNFAPEAATDFRFAVRGQPIAWSGKDQKLTCLGASAPLPAGKGLIQLQILVDRTSIEVFANNGEVSLTSCFLPKPSEKPLAIKGAAKFNSVRVFELQSAWPRK
jgi:fructan beta-fructosidase